MHQYTADLAEHAVKAGHKVHLITTQRYPRDRYAPQVKVHTPLAAGDRGFSAGGLRLDWLVSTYQSLREAKPDLVHFTGPHLWNPLIATWLRRKKVPTLPLRLPALTKRARPGPVG